MQNIDFKEAEKREREVEDIMANRYNRDYHEPPIMAAHSRAFVKYVARFIRPGDRVLDLGCASASLWQHFQTLLPKDITIVGVDLSPKMLEVARVQYPDGDFREGSFLGIPCGSGEFDVVIVSSAFHHINDALLPASLKEIERVLDEHGVLIGREPLGAQRLSDRGGWLSGSMMHLRHQAYRLTGTREYPEPDPGPDHHAYIPKIFLESIEKVLTVIDVEFQNPLSPFLARVKHPLIVKMALQLDEIICHREGQEVLYAARKNFSTARNVQYCIEKILAENKLTDEEIREFLSNVMAVSKIIEHQIQSSEVSWFNCKMVESKQEKLLRILKKWIKNIKNFLS